MYSPSLEQAWAKLALFTPDDIARFIDRLDFRGQGVEWRCSDALGWTIEQLNTRPERDLYSLRVLGNDAFPFGLYAAQGRAAGKRGGGP